MRARRPTSWLLLGTLGAAGCTAISPPARHTHYGAPGRLQQGDLELQGSSAGLLGDGVTVPAFGSAHIGYGVRDWAAVEGGGSFAQDSWAMGYVGPRFTLAPHRERPIHVASDLELGIGAGAGGYGTRAEDGSLADGRSWHDRFAVAAYTGLGLGLHIHWFAVYGRLRLQGSRADGAPATMWNSGVVGLQFRIARLVDLYAAGGFAGYANDERHEYTGLYEIGLAVHFNPSRLRDRRRARRPRATR